MLPYVLRADISWCLHLWFPWKRMSEGWTLMTCYYPDLCGASYWWMKICLNQSVRSTSKVWPRVMMHHQYQISAVIPQASFWGTRGDIAIWQLFCQATESNNKNILKNSKKCFFCLPASQTQMVVVQWRITKWLSLGHGFLKEYSLFYCSLFIMQILLFLLRLMAQYTRYYQMKSSSVLFL